MKVTTRWIAVLFVVAVCAPALSTAESSAQKRTPPPGSGSAAPPSQGRRPAPGTPPTKAVPRPPASRAPERPAPRPPARPPESRTLAYPPYFYDFDFVYRFPYGVYPYSHYPYPPRYGYPVLPPGCVSADEETEGKGAVRLDIPEKEAAVFIDGFYGGAVEDFNGATEPLTLPPGPHHLELRASGYQTLTFDVIVQAGKTITYRTPMVPISKH